MITPDPSSWLITAPPSESIAAQWTRRPGHFAGAAPVFATAPAGWPSQPCPPAAEASASALHVLSQLPPGGNGRGAQAPDTYALPGAPGPAAGSQQLHVQGWDLVLVVDTGTSMSAWYPTVNAFVERTYELPLFADVRIVRLYNQATGAQESLFDRASIEQLGLRLPASHHRRKMIFIITDGVGAAWTSRSIWPELYVWGQHHCLAILHVLPHHIWDRSGVRAEPVQLRSPRPASPNSSLEVRAATPGDTTAEEPSSDSASVFIPVLEMRKRWLDQWARLMQSVLWVQHQALVIPEDPPPPVFPAQSRDRDQTVSAQDRIASFRSTVSENSFQLAVHLAAAPLNRHIMQLIAAQLLPTSGPGDLAAVLTSDLLVTAKDSTAHDDPHDRVMLDFRPGVRQALLSQGVTAKTRKVVNLLDEYLGPYVPAVSGIALRIKEPAGSSDPDLTEETLPYLRVECAVLTALSGDSAPHGRAAQRLDARIKEYEAARTTGQPARS